MQRFSYEWIEEEREPHWTENLYGIFDSMVGFTEECAVAYTITRDDAERIVDALNLADDSRRANKNQPKTNIYDLNDLLN
ncbi:hypothetical protein ACVDG5_018255 [Mesorhizobium sp. ORM6]